jgi:hypothetical protein
MVIAQLEAAAWPMRQLKNHAKKKREKKEDPERGLESSRE